MKVKRLDDASIPTAENTEGLILHGMQNGQTKKVPSELMEPDNWQKSW